MLIFQKTRRAVTERLATARRVFRRIQVIRKKDIIRSGQITRTFGSLAPPKMSPLPRSELADDGVHQ